jgi:hypothetical protein
MKRLSILTVCALCIALALASAAVADDKPVWKFVEKTPPQREPDIQLAIGVGHRIAADDGVQPKALVRADIFYFPYTEIGLKFGAFYNGNTTGYDKAIRNFGVQFGPRLQLKYRVLSPFVESLVDVRHYFGSTKSGDYSNTRGGISLAGGLSLSMSKTATLDVTVRKVFNNPYAGVVYSPTPLPEPPDPPFWGFGDGMTNFYSPTTVEIQYRFKI